MTPSLEGSLTKAKEAPSPHEVRLALLDTNPVFQCFSFSLNSICCQFSNNQVEGMQSKASDRSIRTAPRIKFLSNFSLHSSNK